MKKYSFRLWPVGAVLLVVAMLATIMVGCGGARNGEVGGEDDVNVIAVPSQSVLTLDAMQLSVGGADPAAVTAEAKGLAEAVEEPADNQSDSVKGLCFGQEVRAAEGAIYYETADAAGSGRQGTANNIYTEVLYVAGFAQVNSETGRLEKFRCYQRETVVPGAAAPEFVADCTATNLFIATYTDGFTTGDVGWFCAHDLDWTPDSLEYVEPVSEENVEDPALESPIVDVEISNFNDAEHQYTPEEVASGIEDQAVAGEKIALLLDVSGSVSDYSGAIASYAKQVKNADATIIFAKNWAEIDPADYAEYRWQVDGSGTCIYKAMNALARNDYDVVVIVTDTYTNGYDSLDARDGIGRVVIMSVVPATEIWQHVVDNIEDCWGVAPEVRELTLEPTNS